MRIEVILVRGNLIILGENAISVEALMIEKPNTY